LATFNPPTDPALVVRYFGGEIRRVNTGAFPPVQGRGISHNRIAMVDVSEATPESRLKDVTSPRTLFLGIEAYCGTIVELDLHGTLIARSASRFVPTWVSLSHNGEKFAILGKRIGDSDWIPNIYVGEFNGSEARRVRGVDLGQRYMGQPSLDWSPDGATLLLSHLGSLSLVDVETGHLKDIGSGGSGRWSPKGDWISYLTTQSEVAILRLSSGERKVINPGKQAVSAAEWSPDGDYLLVEEMGGSHVYKGCLWVYRIADGAWAPFPDYGVYQQSWYWIDTRS